MLSKSRSAAFRLFPSSAETPAALAAIRAVFTSWLLLCYPLILLPAEFDDDETETTP